MDLYSGMAEPIEDDEPVKGTDDEKQEASGVQDAPAKTQASVDDRLKRQAQRPSKYLIKHLKEGSHSPNHASGADGSSGANGARAVKNMRRPRNGYGRGLPKKGLPLSSSDC